jgi:hypothetical protein
VRSPRPWEVPWASIEIEWMAKQNLLKYIYVCVISVCIEYILQKDT